MEAAKAEEVKEEEEMAGEEKAEVAMVGVAMVEVVTVEVVREKVHQVEAEMGSAARGAGATEAEVTVEVETEAAATEAAAMEGGAMVEVAMEVVAMEAEEMEAEEMEVVAPGAAAKVVAEKEAVIQHVQLSLHLPGYVHILHIPPSQLPRRPAEVRIQTRSRPGSAHSCRASSTGGSGWAVAVVRHTSLAARCRTQSGQRRRRGRVWCQLIPCRLFGHQGFHRQLGTTG